MAGHVYPYVYSIRTFYQSPLLLQCNQASCSRNDRSRPSSLRDPAWVPASSDRAMARRTRSFAPWASLIYYLVSLLLLAAHYMDSRTMAAVDSDTVVDPAEDRDGGHKHAGQASDTRRVLVLPCMADRASRSWYPTADS